MKYLHIADIARQMKFWFYLIFWGWCREEQFSFPIPPFIPYPPGETGFISYPPVYLLDRLDRVSIFTSLVRREDQQ